MGMSYLHTDGILGTPKDIYVVFPPNKCTDAPVSHLVPLSNHDELKDFVVTHRGNLFNKSGIKLRFGDLQNDEVYTVFGPDYMATDSDIRTRKVERKIEELRAIVAVKSSLVGNFEMHFNVPIAGKYIHEILLQETSDNTHIAYICQPGYDPWSNDTDILAEKVRLFQAMCRNHQAFNTVKKVIPVLSGQSFLPQTLSRKSPIKFWRVQTSAGRPQVFRAFSTTIVRRIRR